MNIVKRLGLVIAISLTLPCFFVFHGLTWQLATVCLRPFPGLLAAAPLFPESLGQVGWLALQCLPVLVWRSWRDVGSLRLRWSWAMLIPLLVCLGNLTGFKGLPIAHPWAGTADLLWHNLLIGANEEVISRGYMFHDRPRLHPRVTVLASSVAFALFHYLNLDTGNFDGVTRQVLFAFLVGINLGVVRLATGSLGVCILIHGAIDASLDLRGQTGEFANLVDAVLQPLWWTLTGLAFCLHPVMRARPADVTDAPASTAPPSRLRRALRWTAVILLGLVGTLALLLSLCGLFLPGMDQAAKWNSAHLLGYVALPVGLLAAALSGRWRRRKADLEPVPSEPPPEAVPANLQASKVGGTCSAYLSLLIALALALVPSFLGRAFSLRPAPSLWRWFQENRLPLGAVTFAALMLCLAAWSLWMACRPRFSRPATVGWLLATVCYGFLTWFDAACLHFHCAWVGLLKISLWEVGLAGLLTTAFLAIHPIRFKPTLPSAVPGR